MRASTRRTCTHTSRQYGAQRSQCTSNARRRFPPLSLSEVRATASIPRSRAGAAPSSVLTGVASLTSVADGEEAIRQTPPGKVRMLDDAIHHR